jgi:NADPH-dependent curcumin reductase CurA
MMNNKGTETNKQWTLERTPMSGWPTDGDFTLSSVNVPDAAKDQFITRTIYLSMDPYQWGRRRSGLESVGDVCHGRTVSEVIMSRHADFSEGDLVFNTNGWQEYGLTGRYISIFNYMLPRKLDASVAPISTAIGVLGMLGLTAYSGVYLQCQPKPGETVVVSAASGGVGQNAGQIAKIKGCRVVGIAGSEEKCRFVEDELVFYASLNRHDEDFREQLAKACPDGIDIYFENVGGEVYEAVLPLLNKQSRISLCGLISQYGNEDGGSPQEAWQQKGSPFFEANQVTVHGLFVGNFVETYQAQFLSEMGEWVKDGLIKYKEDRWQGIESAPAAFTAMLSGANFGKTIVQVGGDPTFGESNRLNQKSNNVLAGFEIK